MILAISITIENSKISIITIHFVYEYFLAPLWYNTEFSVELRISAT